jgi:UDP-glucose:(heptosyl)LPS alpha-1,3-glucosyltransferase
MNFDIKGLDAVIASVARLKSRNLFEKFKLLVVGKGNEKHYRRLAHDLGIQDHVIFSGVVEKENLEHIYLASDVYVMLSKFDTFGLVVLEAMAASLPVVISGNVGAKDLIREGINGFVINDTDDPDTMAKKLGGMLDEDVRTRMAQAAFETASAYPWEKTVKEVEAVYEELLR